MDSRVDDFSRYSKYDTFKLIGFWKPLKTPKNPDKHCNDDLPLPEINMLPVYKGFLENYKRVINDKRITETVDCFGSTVCRICNKSNGNKEHYINNGNSGFIVPSGYLHYMEDHDVHPPIDFFTYVNIYRG